MRRSRSFLPAVPALLLASCAIDALDLPRSPDGDVPPEFVSFEPAHAYAGWLIRVTGKNLGDRADGVTVEFGGEAVSRAVSLDSDTIYVRVPLDATTGSLTLVTGNGRSAPSTEAFTVDGRGAPANPQPLVRADLRATLEHVVETDAGLLLLDHERYRRAALANPLGGPTRPFPGDEPIDVAKVGLVSTVLDVTGACDADLIVVGENSEGPYEFKRIALREPDNENLWCLEPRTVAGSPSGLAVVLAHHTAWVIDPFETQPILATLPIGDGDREFTSPVAFAGENRFVAGAQDRVVLIDKAGDDWTLSLLDASVVGDLESVGANDDGRVVALSDMGELGVLEVGDGNPRFVNLGVVSAVDGGRLALSDDGQTAAISPKLAERVVTYTDLLTSPLPIASVEVEWPGRIERASRGRWLVASRGQVVELAQRTGQLLGLIKVDAALRGPVVRRTNAAGVQVVEVVSESFKRLRRLEALTLFEDTEALSPGGPIASFASATFGAPGGRSTFVEVGGRGIEQWTGRATTANRVLPFPEGLRYGEHHAAATDETLVVAEVLHPTELDSFLVAWDLTVDPPVPPKLANVGFHGYDELRAGEGRVLGAHFSRGFELLDANALVRGEKLVVGEPVTFTGDNDSFSLVSVGLGHGLAVVVGVSGQVGVLDSWVLRLSDGAVVGRWTGRSRNPIDTFSFSPSLRFLWWTASFDGTSRLSIGTFDVESGVVDGGRAQTSLPGANPRVAPDASGERLYALDPDSETLTLIQ